MIALIFFLNCFHCFVSAKNLTNLISEKELENYIANGKPANASEFPYLLAIAYKSRTGEMRLTCHGVLIRPRWIVAAASCIQ